MGDLDKHFTNTELDKRASEIGEAISKPILAMIQTTGYIRDGFIIDLSVVYLEPTVEYVVDRDNWTRQLQKAFIKGIEENLLPMLKDFKGLKKIEVEQLRPGFVDIHIYIEEAHYIFPASYL